MDWYQSTTQGLGTPALGPLSREDKIFCVWNALESYLIPWRDGLQWLGRGSGSESVACFCHESGREGSFRSLSAEHAQAILAVREWTPPPLLNKQGASQKAALSRLTPRTTQDKSSKVTSPGGEGQQQEHSGQTHSWRESSCALFHTNPWEVGNLEEITGLTPIVYVRAPVINRKNKCEQIHHPILTHMFALVEINSLVEIKIKTFSY